MTAGRQPNQSDLLSLAQALAAFSVAYGAMRKRASLELPKLDKPEDDPKVH